MVQEFDGSHRGHTVVTLDVNEIKDQYQNIEPEREFAPIQI